MLDPSKHKIEFEAPTGSESAAVSIEVLQSVEDDSGAIYASAS